MNLHPETIIKLLKEKQRKRSPRYRTKERLLSQVTKSTGSQSQNKQMGLLYQTKRLLFSKGNDQQSQEATNGTGEKSLHAIQQTANQYLGFTKRFRN